MESNLHLQEQPQIICTIKILTGVKRATKLMGQVLQQLQGRHGHFQSLLLMAGLG